MREVDPSVRQRSAYLKAKANGFLSMVNFQLESFPKEACEFNHLNFDNVNTWEDMDLTKIDFSHNNISEIDENMSALQGLI